MSTPSNKATGGCLCGAIRYQVSGLPLSTIYCHCSSCRKHTGAPVVALVGFRRDQVSYETHAPKVYESSPGVGRAFCDQCGTPLTWEGDGGDDGPLVEILISTLDNPGAFKPEYHVHHGERISWFETSDTLPRYRVWNDGHDAPYLHAPASVTDK